jgi:2-dehydro-3-deoxyphosphogluconate aldolase/(4S)-4-hydroxy-2-oxoglutarate aldolase
LESGASALGVGADLVNLTALAEGKPEVITIAARAYLDIIARTRAAAKA